MPLRRRASLTNSFALAGWLLSIVFLTYILYHSGSPQDAIIPAERQPFGSGGGGGGGLLDESLKIAEKLGRGRDHFTSPSSTGLSSQSGAGPAVQGDRSVFGPWSSFKTLFFFGDSYTSTNFDVWEQGPRPEQPLGNHGALQKLNELTWATFLTSTHNKSVVLSYNLAVGGSTIDHRIAKPYILGSDFSAECDLFLDHYGPEARYFKAAWDPASTLFFVWFGINDLILEWYEEFPKPPDMVGEFVSYRNTTDRLYAAGARKFIFLTVPPAYRSVDFTPETLLTIAEDMALFNARIFEMRTALAAAYPDATFAVFDTHSFWARVIENPKEFEETKDVLFANEVCQELEKDDDGNVVEVKLVPVVQKRDTPKKGAARPADLPPSAANAAAVAPPEEWMECEDGAPRVTHLWTRMHGTAVIHNATSARLVQDCLGPEGKKGYCF